MGVEQQEYAWICKNRANATKSWFFTMVKQVSIWASPHLITVPRNTFIASKKGGCQPCSNQQKNATMIFWDFYGIRAICRYMRSQSPRLASTNQPMTQPVTMALVAWDHLGPLRWLWSIRQHVPIRCSQPSCPSSDLQQNNLGDLRNRGCTQNSGPKATQTIQEYRKGVSFSMKTGPVRLSLGFHHVRAASHLRAATRLSFRLRLAGCESALSSSKITGYDCSCPSNQRGKPGQNVEIWNPQDVGIWTVPSRVSQAIGILPTQFTPLILLCGVLGATLPMFTTVTQS